ncbi:MAG: FAD-dependent oxidoreductase [Alphaproteobacteria bacterium]|nr:FAD-dependent oxidoreductase [Alphaproteobacteria bacterium]
MSNIPVCHIIGGGLSGVACAYFLKKHYPDFHSVIYEAKEYIGGRSCSQYDDEWNMHINNAAHMVLSSDRFMKNFVHEEEWSDKVLFFDMDTLGSNIALNDNTDVICQKICNTSYDDIAAKVKSRILKIFKSNFKHLKFYAFNRDLTQRVINVLASYADEIHCSCRLTKIMSRKGHAHALCFGRRSVKLRPCDRVIFALDNTAAAPLLKIPSLEYNNSVSISYYTSQTIFLPHGASFVGVKGGVADWISISPNIISAQICNYENNFTTLDKLALYIWGEISRIRGVNSAFMPSYRMEVNRHASVKMDNVNNSLRPDNAKTIYDNIFMCGDWTMKNYPCTLETAALSGERAVRTMLKFIK